MAQAEIVTFKRKDGVIVGTINLPSMLDALDVSDFGSQVVDFVKAHEGLNLLLNFEKVDFLSSSTLTELIRISKLVEQKRGRIRLCGVTPDIRRVFEITKLDQLFTIEEGNLKATIQKFARAIEVQNQEQNWQERRGKA